MRAADQRQLRYGQEGCGIFLGDADVKAVVFHCEFAPTEEARHAAALPSWSTTSRGAAPRRRHRVRGCDGGAVPSDFGPRSPDDLYILYTGGTTGMPKGVMWRAEDIFFGAFGGGNLGEAPITSPEEIVDSVDLHRRGLPACPFMHGTAHWMAFGTLYSGGTVVISPDRHLDPARLWRLIEHERATFLVIVGDAFARPLVEAFDRLDPAPDVTPLTVLFPSKGAVAVGEGGVGERFRRCWWSISFGARDCGGPEVPAAGAHRMAHASVNDETTVLKRRLRPSRAAA